MNIHRTGFYSTLYLLIWASDSWEWAAMAATASPTIASDNLIANPSFEQSGPSAMPKGWQGVAQFILPLVPRSIRVLSEGRQVHPDGATFEDDFRRLSVHLYEVELPPQ